MSYYARISKFTKKTPISVRWRSIEQFAVLRDGIVQLEGQPMPPVRGAIGEYLNAWSAVKAKMYAAPTPPLDLFIVDDEETLFTALVFDQEEELREMLQFLDTEPAYAAYCAARDALAVMLQIEITVKDIALLPIEDLAITRPSVEALNSLM